MHIRTLRAFLALYQHGTIASAAERVHLSPAAVSVQLKNLEAELRVELFTRTKRSLGFTAAAHHLAPIAQKVLAAYEEMRALSGRGTVEGVLLLGVVTSALSGILPSLLRKFMLGNSGIEIKIVGGNSADLFAQVNAGSLDAAITTQPPVSVKTTLQVHHLYSEPFVLLMPSGTQYMSLAATLASAPYIAFDRSTWAGQMIASFLEKLGVDARPAMELNSLDAIVVMVRQALGVSIVPLIRGASWHDGPDLRIVRMPFFDRPVAMVERPVHMRLHLTAALLSSFGELASEEAEPAAQI